MSSLTKNQHYVWQYYLRAWEKQGKIWCKRTGQPEPFSTSSRNIGAQRFFYQFFELTPEDINYLDYLISLSNNHKLQELNQGWIEHFQKSFEIRRRLKNTEIDSNLREQLNEKLLDIEKTIGEHYHCTIEKTAFPLINMLKQQDTTFYEDVSSRNDFINYISHQYFRTARMKNAKLAIPNPLPYDTRRTWPIEAFIYATNLASSIVAEGRKYHFVFLRNKSNLSFITGDQPIINLAGHKGEKVDFYYPLTPDLAIIFTADKIQYPDICADVGVLDIESYNYQVYNTSDNQIYGNDPIYLKVLSELPKNI